MIALALDSMPHTDGLSSSSDGSPTSSKMKYRVYAPFTSIRTCVDPLKVLDEEREHPGGANGTAASRWVLRRTFSDERYNCRRMSSVSHSPREEIEKIVERERERNREWEMIQAKTPSTSRFSRLAAESGLGVVGLSYWFAVRERERDKLRERDFEAALVGGRVVALCLASPHKSIDEKLSGTKDEDDCEVARIKEDIQDIVARLVKSEESRSGGRRSGLRVFCVVRVGVLKSQTLHGGEGDYEYVVRSVERSMGCRLPRAPSGGSSASGGNGSPIRQTAMSFGETEAKVKSEATSEHTMRQLADVLGAMATAQREKRTVWEALEAAT